MPLLAYGFEEVEEDRSMFEERRGRVREGVTGEEGIMGIFGVSCLAIEVKIQSRGFATCRRIMVPESKRLITN